MQFGLCGSCGMLIPPLGLCCQRTCRCCCEQVDRLVADGSRQAVSNVLLSLGWLTTEPEPPVARQDAQAVAQRLLAGVNLKGIGNWDAQHITNMLGLALSLTSGILHV